MDSILIDTSAKTTAESWLGDFAAALRHILAVMETRAR